MQHPSPLWPCCRCAGGVLQGSGLRLPVLELFTGQSNGFNSDLRSWLQIQKDPHSCLLGSQALSHFVLACQFLMPLGALMDLERWVSSFRSTAYQEVGFWMIVVCKALNKSFCIACSNHSISEVSLHVHHAHSQDTRFPQFFLKLTCPHKSK